MKLEEDGLQRINDTGVRGIDSSAQYLSEPNKKYCGWNRSVLKGFDQNQRLSKSVRLNIVNLRKTFKF